MLPLCSPEISITKPGQNYLLLSFPSPLLFFLMSHEYNRFNLRDTLFTSGQQLTVFLVPIRTSTLAKSFKFMAEIITEFSYTEIGALVLAITLNYYLLLHTSSYSKETFSKITFLRKYTGSCTCFLYITLQTSPEQLDT